MSGEISRGLLDTNIIILRGAISASDLPEEMAISAVTLAELSAGVNSVPGDSEDAVRERARRVAILQRTEREFDPLPFDAAAARIYGQLASALLTIGRTSRQTCGRPHDCLHRSGSRHGVVHDQPKRLRGAGRVCTSHPVTRPRVSADMPS